MHAIWRPRRCGGMTLWSVLVLATVACSSRYRDDLDYSYDVEQTWQLDDLHSGDIVQFESVFWEPSDTLSLRHAIVEDSIVNGRDVLEIGTGTGLLSILCKQNDAMKVVATDINPAAVANARYNAAILIPDYKLDVRLVSTDSPGAFEVIEEGEKFDLIVSNPPWEDGQITQPADHAYYDPGFELMDSLLDGLPQHLKPGGRCLLAYGHVPAIERLQEESTKRGYRLKILDDRKLQELDENFLPGMLIEIRVPVERTIVANGEFKSVAEQSSGESDSLQDSIKDESIQDDESNAGDQPSADGDPSGPTSE